MITSKPRKPRAKSPLRAFQLQVTWDNCINTRRGDGLTLVDQIPSTLTSTELRSASNGWRKLLSYLNEPPETPQRIEAEQMLREMGLLYTSGEFNSRTFGLDIPADVDITARSALFAAEDKHKLRDKPIPLSLLGASDVTWDHIRVLAGNPESESWLVSDALLRALGLIVEKGFARFDGSNVRVAQPSATPARTAVWAGKLPG